MSISGYSYKDVEARLKAFADGHYVIRRYSVGEATDFDASDGTWPLMHVVHPAITPDAGQVTYNFEVVFADLPRDFDDKTGNQVEAISDLIRLALDLLSEIKNGSVLFGEDALVTSSNIDTGAVQSFNSVCIARLTFTLVLPWDWNACDIPADYAPAGSSTSLFPIDGGCCDVEYYISKNNQPGNNFALGDVIRVSGTNTFAKARANTLANSYAVGVVTALGGDAYNYKMGGIVTEGVPNHPAGTIMYLSDSVAGAMTTTPPAIVRPVMVIVEPAARAILMLSLVNASGGAVDSVNGQTGVVVLDAGDVGADVAGSAATAESNANDYTDTQIAGLAFVTSIDVTADGDAITPTGGPVTSSGAINIEFNGAATDYIDGEGNLQTFPTIPTGTVESVTGDSVDNTDPDNPVVNAIPLAGTTTGNPVTGPIQGAGLTLIDDITDPTTFTSELQVGADIRMVFTDLVNSYITRFILENGIINVSSGDPAFEGIKYGDDYSANFVDRSLVDKAYVDSVTPNITSGTAPPSGGNDGDIYLQYT
jgi:hypothetical protein